VPGLAILEWRLNFAFTTNLALASMALAIVADVNATSHFRHTSVGTLFSSLLQRSHLSYLIKDNVCHLWASTRGNLFVCVKF